MGSSNVHNNRFRKLRARGPLAMLNLQLLYLLLFLAASTPQHLLARSPNALPFNTLVRRFRASIASGDLRAAQDLEQFILRDPHPAALPVLASGLMELRFRHSARALRYLLTFRGKHRAYVDAPLLLNMHHLLREAGRHTEALEMLVEATTMNVGGGTTTKSLVSAHGQLASAYTQLATNIEAIDDATDATEATTALLVRAAVALASAFDLAGRGRGLGAMLGMEPEATVLTAVRLWAAIERHCPMDDDTRIGERPLDQLLGPDCTALRRALPRQGDPTPLKRVFEMSSQWLATRHDHLPPLPLPPPAADAAAGPLRIKRLDLSALLVRERDGARWTNASLSHAAATLRSALAAHAKAGTPLHITAGNGDDDSGEGGGDGGSDGATDGGSGGGSDVDAARPSAALFAVLRWADLPATWTPAYLNRTAGQAHVYASCQTETAAGTGDNGDAAEGEGGEERHSLTNATRTRGAEDFFGDATQRRLMRMSRVLRGIWPRWWSRQDQAEAEEGVKDVHGREEVVGSGGTGMEEEGIDQSGDADNLAGQRCYLNTQGLRRSMYQPPLSSSVALQRDIPLPLHVLPAGEHEIQTVTLWAGRQHQQTGNPTSLRASSYTSDGDGDTGGGGGGEETRGGADGQGGEAAQSSQKCAERRPGPRGTAATPSKNIRDEGSSSSGGRPDVSRFHHDQLDNLIVLVSGRKRYALIPPRHAPDLYTVGAIGRMSERSFAYTNDMMGSDGDSHGVHFSLIPDIFPFLPQGKEGDGRSGSNGRLSLESIAAARAMARRWFPRLLKLVDGESLAEYDDSAGGGEASNQLVPTLCLLLKTHQS